MEDVLPADSLGANNNNGVDEEREQIS